MAIETATRPRIHGPASHFSSIERTYGESIEHWIDLIHDRARDHQGERPEVRALELVGWLKAEHGLGHGHAHALVVHALGARARD